MPDLEPEAAQSRNTLKRWNIGHAQLATPSGKNHEVLVRVKGILVKQEQTIKNQQKEIESMRAEIAKMNKTLNELRTKTNVDDQSIAELAEFLQQHEGDESPSRESEAA